jgi:hypothetical protein
MIFLLNFLQKYNKKNSLQKKICFVIQNYDGLLHRMCILIKTEYDNNILFVRILATNSMRKIGLCNIFLLTQMLYKEQKTNFIKNLYRFFSKEFIWGEIQNSDLDVFDIRTELELPANFYSFVCNWRFYAIFASLKNKISLLSG